LAEILTEYPEIDEYAIKPSAPLDMMQVKWADAYCGPARGNARKASRIAGYPESRCHYYAHVNRHNPVLMQYCADMIMAQRVMTKEEVLWKLTEHANATMEHFINKDGEIDLSIPSAKKHIHLLTEVDQEVRQDMEGNPVRKTKIKLQSQQRALELIGKAHGLFADRIEHSGSVSVNFNAYENIPDDELERRIAEEERNFRNARIVSEPTGSGVAEVQERPDILD
jgi:hypothetical protein